MSTHRGTMSPYTGVMDLRTESMKVMEIMKVNKREVKRERTEGK